MNFFVTSGAKAPVTLPQIGTAEAVPFPITLRGTTEVVP
jgi:hypothetical protein